MTPDAPQPTKSLEFAEEMMMRELAAACKLGSKELAGRIEYIQSLFKSASKRMSDGHIEWFLEPDENLLGKLKELVELEKRCCPDLKPKLSLVVSVSLPD